MAHPIFSAEEAARAACQPEHYLLWVKATQAERFQEPGWTRLEPPRDGAILFVHRDREMRAVRARGIV